MNRRDQLYENYQDALFALLMDKVAEAEGARLIEENERLKNDPEAAVPEEIDKKCRETIRRAFGARRRRVTAHTVGWLVNKIALVVLAAVLLFVTAYATIPDVQFGTLSLLLENSDVASRLSLEGNEAVPEEPAGELLMGYQLPTLDETFVETDRGEDPNSSWVKFEKSHGATVLIDINKQAGKAYYDTEDIDTFTDIDVNGCPGAMLSKDNWTKITWLDKNSNYCIEVTCLGLQEDFALSLAEQIVFVGK